MNQWQEQIKVRDVHADDLLEVLDLLLEHLGLKLMREQTPDYTSYELAPKNGVRVVDQRQRFEAWAGDQGYPLKKLETSDSYLDLRTHGAWEAYQRGTADGVGGNDGR